MTEHILKIRTYPTINVIILANIFFVEYLLLPTEHNYAAENSLDSVWEILLINTGKLTEMPLEKKMPQETRDHR